jgi:hypothetical protein
MLTPQEPKPEYMRPDEAVIGPGRASPDPLALT